MLQWNVKGDSVANTVLTIGSLVAAIILLFWLGKNLSPQQDVLQTVDDELSVLQRNLNTACRMTYYWKNHEPRVNKGSLIINDQQVCIDTSNCQVIFYQSDSEEQNIVQQDNKIIVNEPGIKPCDDILKCKRLSYHDDGNTPEVFFTNTITVNNAYTCSDEDYIGRCRLTTCDLGRQTINLEGLLSINITREDETFTFEPK